MGLIAASLIRTVIFEHEEPIAIYSRRETELPSLLIVVAENVNTNSTVTLHSL